MRRTQVDQQEWSRVEEIFQGAVERPPGQRHDFLFRACGENTALREEVESLLASHDRHGSFIESAIRDAAGALVEMDAPPLPADIVGRRLGAWRITGVIGQGGMGAVYEAVRDDDHYRQHVALKIVKGGIDTEFLRTRFRHERQILASLVHPNIARLLDGGATEEGLPWFAMERVEGRSIGEYCVENRLSIADRLHLFRQVCSAVQYAHRNLIVHRDIKPGNILVTKEGIPKLLDFGIARAVEPETISGDPGAGATVTMLRMLTPDYASPEQVTGAPVTTATDVYSLGAVLYEILTGKRAHQITGSSPGKIERAVCQTDPVKPSLVAPAFKRKLGGDLDNIVLMAMRKEPERRYSSVEQLSDDIRRYLEGLPVKARADTLRYSSGKFVRRHKVAVIAASLVVLSLLFGVFASTYEARLAERRFNQVRGLANTVLFDIYDAIENLPGSTKARKLVVQTGLNYIDSLAREASGDRSLTSELGGAYLRIGDVQGHVLTSNLGDTAGALQSYRKAQSMFETLVKQEPGNNEFKQHLATISARVGDSLAYMGNLKGSIESYDRAASLEQILIKADPSNEQPRHDLASLQFYIARALMNMGDIRGAMERSALSLSMHREQLASHPRRNDLAGMKLRKEITADHSSIGMLLARENDVRGALAHFRENVVILEELVAEAPLQQSAKRALMLAYGHLGDHLGNPTMPNLGDTEGALEQYRKMLALAETMAREDPVNKLAAADYAIALMHVGECVTDHAEALNLFRKSLAIMEPIAAEDSKNARLQSRMIQLRFGMGDRQLAMRQPAAALLNYRTGIASARKMSASDPKDMEIRGALAAAYR
ncbi:MAG: protein kinase, partial [Acidobacteriota bacterium]|nr:protein kinase [Acidobacteriota bacterium]